MKKKFDLVIFRTRTHWSKASYTSLQFEYFLEMIMIGPKKFLSCRYPAKYEVQYFSG